MKVKKRQTKDWSQLMYLRSHPRTWPNDIFLHLFDVSFVLDLFVDDNSAPIDLSDKEMNKKQ